MKKLGNWCAWKVEYVRLVNEGKRKVCQPGELETCRDRKESRWQCEGCRHYSDHPSTWEKTFNNLSKVTQLVSDVELNVINEHSDSTFHTISSQILLQIFSVIFLGYYSLFLPLSSEEKKCTFYIIFLLNLFFYPIFRLYQQR